MSYLYIFWAGALKKLMPHPRRKGRKMIIRRKMKPYRDSKPINFVLLWVEEDVGVKGTPANQPCSLEPTKKQLSLLVNKEV